MAAGAQEACGAEYGERSPERVNSRNGYRLRDWDTRVGLIQLAVPQAATRQVRLGLAAGAQTQSRTSHGGRHRTGLRGWRLHAKVEALVRTQGIQSISKCHDTFFEQPSRSSNC